MIFIRLPLVAASGRSSRSGATSAAAGQQILLILGQAKVHEGVAAAHSVIQEIARLHVSAKSSGLIGKNGSVANTAGSSVVGPE